MPSSINGIGTGLIPASPKRKNEGRTQFDAIEAGTFAYLPFLPYKAVHVLDMQGFEYRFVPLRLSSRLIVRAFLNRWGNGFLLAGGMLLGIAACMFISEKRPLTANDLVLLTVFGSVFLLGIVFKIAWLLLTRKDEQIKNLVGPHALGTSDPRDWQAEQADAMTAAIIEQEGLPSLVDVAHRAVKAGDQAQAAFCLRLALRDPNNIEAQDLMDRLYASRGT
jgi:hypothetical protein